MATSEEHSQAILEFLDYALSQTPPLILPASTTLPAARYLTVGQFRNLWREATQDKILLPSAKAISATLSPRYPVTRSSGARLTGLIPATPSATPSAPDPHTRYSQAARDAAIAAYTEGATLPAAGLIAAHHHAKETGTPLKRSATDPEAPAPVHPSTVAHWLRERGLSPRPGPRTQIILKSWETRHRKAEDTARKSQPPPWKASPPATDHKVTGDEVTKNALDWNSFV